jgi:HAD superfamily hydrolase (TIGR01549 family)
MIFYKKLEQIQAITFDLDDTLYENTSIIINAERQLIELMHSTYPVTKQVDRLFWRQQQKKQLMLNPLLKNDMSELRRLALRSGFSELGIQGQALIQATDHCFDYFYYQRSNFTLNENIHSLLKNLSDRLPLIAITNGNVDLQQIGIAAYFNACFKASIALPMKPNQAMFNAAQNFLNIPHKYILHVGDHLQKDVYAALKAGYQAAWYAADRQMDLNQESTQMLPHVQLTDLSQLLSLI